MSIKFYLSTDEFNEFSNFYRRDIFVDDETWSSIEHYYQAMKSEYPIMQKTIRKAQTPGEAKRMGAAIRLRSDWEEIKHNVMRKAVQAKFEQHPDLQALLLSTKNKELIEDSPKDYIWGCGKDGSGENWLGIILMETRDKLRKTPYKVYEETGIPCFVCDKHSGIDCAGREPGERTRCRVCLDEFMKKLDGDDSAQVLSAELGRRARLKRYEETI